MGDEKLGTRVEVKNLNSIRFIKKAIEFESQRLIGLHQRGEAIIQQTRGFRESDFTTYAIRSKEDEDDYRYFPEPDLPPFYISDEMISSIRSKMPPLQENIKTQLMSEYHLSDYDAGLIADDMELTGFFFELVSKTKNYKAGANWILGPVKNLLSANINSDKEIQLSSEGLVELIELIDAGRINYGIASRKFFLLLSAIRN